MKKRVVIVGAGAAGMLAAIAAAQQGSEVTILEKMDRQGRKIAITGKGRCNITNSSSMSQFLEKTGPDSRFLKNSFARFFSKEIIEMLEQEGVAVVEERGGRYFPESQKAADVNRALTSRMAKLGVKVMTNCRVESLIIDSETVTGVKLINGRAIVADSVIMATGGVSYPGTGSTGDGYKILKEVGHKIVNPRPSLVPILTKGDLAGRLQGLALKNVTAAVWKGGKKIGEEFGEMLFTHFGLSGPIILTLSRRFSAQLENPEDLIITVDLKPALDHQKLDLRLQRELEEHGKMLMHNILHSLMPSSMVDVCLEETQIDGALAGHQLKSDQRKRLRNWLKEVRFQVTGVRGFREAIITAGGVSTKEIDPKTMQSKIVKGLYVVGELLDLDADTGGYNLQIAFSTGWVAGVSCSSEIHKNQN